MERFMRSVSHYTYYVFMHFPCANQVTSRKNKDHCFLLFYASITMC